jgi:hypothetical protein
MTPMPQGPLWAAASGFGGAGFFVVGLAGDGLVGDDVGAAVGAVCARAACASANASNKAAVRVTSRSAVSIRLDRQNCNRESVRVNRANTSVRTPLSDRVRRNDSGRGPNLPT